jgi:lipopolysaccharide biosynthesis glycosyltransferase
MVSLTPPPAGRRPFIEQIKWGLVSFLCAFVPFKQNRIAIRYHLLRPRVYIGAPPLPLKKRLEPINVAFCFNGRIARQAGVTIASLLANSKNRASYNIHCVADDTVTPEVRDSLAGVVKNLDQDSTLTFLEANHDFDQCPSRHSNAAPYYRLMLPALLPELDEVIYADVDAIFCRDLVELADLDLGDNLLAGVQEGLGGYINSGLMVMNLARLRQEKIYDTWPQTRLQEDFSSRFHDQDLVNITCRGRILLLPTKYNFCSLLHFNFYRRGAISPQDHHDLKYNVVMVHYAGHKKPWRVKRFYLSELWWEYARLTPFYEDFRAELEKAGR